ncbi:unnamed protein product [Blepharisma stoltei]|uniref:Uncharacterized protein n=1 Tax=Blepharisma stoltei TaxID=1481888 RepID=A0AAU9IQ42_9CILI|nr:unnamed protein product [Blepharisma stoltei]
MGTCTAKQDAVASKKPAHIRVPDFDYLNRSKKLLCHVTPESIEKHQFKSKIKIRADSTVGYISNDRMIVVGGSDSSGMFTNNACIIDSKSKKATVIARLPISAKEGVLLEYNEWIFYVGAVIQDEESLIGVSGASVMRYNVNENYWEIFLDEANKGHEENPISKEFKLKDLLYPGCFMINSKIYFVGGQRINTKGKLRSSKKVFTLDCKSLKVKKEEIRLPIKVVNPICASGSGHAIIAGGDNPKTQKHSLYCYLFSLDPRPEFKPMEVIGFSLTEHYPAIYIPGKGPIFINYPGVAFKEKHTANWHHLDFAKISPDIEDQNFSHHKYEVEKLPSGEAHETVMNLSVEIDILAKLKKKEKLNDEKAKTPKNEESKVTKEQSEKEEIGIKNKSSSISNSSSSDKEGKESKEISKEKTVINADASKRDAKEIKISSEGSSSSDESNVKRKIEIKLNKKVPTIIHSPKVDIKTKSKKQISESSDEENFRVSAPKIENSKVEPKLTLKLPKQRKSSSSDYSSDIETGKAGLKPKIQAKTHLPKIEAKANVKKGKNKFSNSSSSEEPKGEVYEEDKISKKSLVINAETPKEEHKIVLKLPRQRKSSSSDYSSDIETGKPGLKPKIQSKTATPKVNAKIKNKRSSSSSSLEELRGKAETEIPGIKASKTPVFKADIKASESKNKKKSSSSSSENSSSERKIGISLKGSKMKANEEEAGEKGENKLNVKGGKIKGKVKL